MADAHGNGIRLLNHVLIFLTLQACTRLGEALPACESEIWCRGSLLHDVQMARIYKDSKTFVDMNIKDDPATVLSAYSNLSHSTTPSKADLEDFVDQYFEGPGTEFEPWTPADYTENPPFLEQIKDAKLRNFGSELCKIWSHLGRKIKTDVRDNPDRYSLIYLEKPFIIPGGRFREIYYWDSYWTIKGLLKCGMNETVKGMLENFMTLIQKYDLVPNGGRIYYTRRSQPPLLIPMVDAYVKATGDTTFLSNVIRHLVTEHNFWEEERGVLNNHLCVNNTCQLNHYAAPITEPRPESYREDFELGEQIDDQDGKREEFHSNIASAAESGWDFSTRWFSRDYAGTSKSKWLLRVNTKDVLPVDLNSLLCWNEKMLAEMYSQLGNEGESKKWAEKHTHRVQAVTDVFWDGDAGSWFDYRISDGSHNNNFYPSNMFPLYTGCYPLAKKLEFEREFLKYIKNQTLLNYVSGIPTSLVNSGQQWDLPNAWPPLMHAMITSLADFTNGEGRQVAFDLAQKWLASNYDGWKRTRKMFEKYVVTATGSRGVGGEYDVQEGFGWTNGAALDLLDMFGKQLTLKQPESSPGTNRAHAHIAETNIVTFIVVILVANLF